MTLTLVGLEHGPIVLEGTCQRRAALVRIDVGEEVRGANVLAAARGKGLPEVLLWRRDAGVVGHALVGVDQVTLVVETCLRMVVGE